MQLGNALSLYGPFMQIVSALMFLDGGPQLWVAGMVDSYPK